ncbi:DNA-directed RNA polymerase III subunit RPC8 [Striga asiatica]|uniref:DNA-directed RNA polymerase III subunit RPC8 n=1 Tax=Striga asiatica TaxID=4170 RepID=A0A5A7RBR2_STRAF|nr:DNA-directed RNA polymerase III subunit RPC8 [Striga asiatica]
MVTEESNVIAGVLNDLMKIEQSTEVLGVEGDLQLDEGEEIRFVVLNESFGHLFGEAITYASYVPNEGTNHFLFLWRVLRRTLFFFAGEVDGRAIIGSWVEREGGGSEAWGRGREVPLSEVPLPASKPSKVRAWKELERVREKLSSESKEHVSTKT